MKKKTTKYIHEGRYVAAVEVELIHSDEGWAPYISLEDAFKLDEVREALRNNNIRLAGTYSKVFRMEPLAG